MNSSEKDSIGDRLELEWKASALLRVCSVRLTVSETTLALGASSKSATGDSIEYCYEKVVSSKNEPSFARTGLT